ncbi:MAG TPA: hypothetical protein VGQ73_04815 [Gemmatimonadales bacterium]|jgi:hypothetical protein|nr:hypothetical protein [Gemmatimonadales bacterium]
MIRTSRSILIFTCLAVGSACGKNLVSNEETFSVLLRNVDDPLAGQPIHIFGPDETNEPENRLQPGGERGYLVPTFLSDDGHIGFEFTAGRNFGKRISS